MSRAIGIDSNTLTYLLDAMDENYDPAADKDLGNERLAMIRMLLYSARLLWVGPTVEAEYQKIPNPDNREVHRRLAQYVLEDQPLRVDPAALEARVCELRCIHQGDADCRVLAETEFAHLDTLLSCDNRMLGAFLGLSKVRVRRPSDFWESLGIPPGSGPVKTPAPGHPLYGKSWWRHGDA